MAGLLLLLTGSASAQDSLGMRRVSTLEYWQGAYDIQMTGDTVFVLGGVSGLYIMDLSDPANPVEIGRCTWYDLSSVSGGLHIVGNLAYAATDSGLLIFDISDPAHPVRIAHWGYGEIGLEDIYVHGNIGIGVSCEGSPFVLDLSDFGNIQVVSDFHAAGGMTSPVGMAGEYLCMNGHGLTVWDVNDPTEPRRVAAVDTSFRSHYAVMFGDYFYLSTLYDGVRIIDISDPLQPVEVGHCESAGCGSVTVVGDYLFVSKYDHMSIWNISDPTQPVLANTYPLRLQFPFSVIVSSGNVLCAATEERLSCVAVLDVSEPAEPVEVSSIGHKGYLRRMAVNGTVGYLAGGGMRGMSTFDFTDPTNLFELGIADETFTPTSYDVGVYGDYAYTTKGYDGIVVFNVSDPANPDSIGTFLQGRASAERIIISNDLAFAVGDSIRVFSLEDPAAPVRVDTATVRGDLRDFGFEVQDDCLYLGSSMSFLIYNISSPAAPQLIGSLDLPEMTGAYMTDIAIAGEYAYVAYVAGGLRIIDISDLAEPAEVAMIEGDIYSVAVSGTTLVASDDGVIRVLDVTNPLDPIQVGYYNTDACPKQMMIVGPHLLTLSTCQIRIYECDALTNTETHPIPVPGKLELFPCYPNPFNPATTIRFSLPEEAVVQISVFNILGQRVATLLDSRFPVGTHSVVWNGDDFNGQQVAAGVYICQIKAGQFVDIKKMVLIR